jgi:hypothetical protein
VGEDYLIESFAVKAIKELSYKLLKNFSEFHPNFFPKIELSLVLASTKKRWQCFFPGCKVVKDSTHNPEVEGSNPAAENRKC